MNAHPRTLALTAGLLSLAMLSACSTKSSSSDGGEVGGIKTGVGVTGNTISVSQLTDLSGPFAPVGKAALAGNQLFFDALNADGGVCGKFKVKIDVQDTGYVLQNSIQQYGTARTKSLALLGTMGGPANAALLPKLEQDKIINIPNSWSRTLTSWEGNLIPGATYDVDIVNGLDYLMQEKKIADGDTIGHVYFKGEYGEGGLAGSKAYAKLHDLKLVPIEINPTDTDMSTQVGRLLKENVKAIVLSAAPTHSASVASSAAAGGFDGPILSNLPGFSEGILQGAAGDELRKNFYLATPYQSALPADSPYLATYKKENKNATPSGFVIGGIGQAALLSTILEKACDMKDLTREGLLAAKKSITSADTGGLMVDINPSLEGTSPSLKTNIERPGKDALEPVVSGFEGPGVKTLK